MKHLFTLLFFLTPFFTFAYDLNQPTYIYKYLSSIPVEHCDSQANNYGGRANLFDPISIYTYVSSGFSGCSSAGGDYIGLLFDTNASSSAFGTVTFNVSLDVVATNCSISILASNLSGTNPSMSIGLSEIINATTTSFSDYDITYDYSSRPSTQAGIGLGLAFNNSGECYLRINSITSTGFSGIDFTEILDLDNLPSGGTTIQYIPVNSVVSSSSCLISTTSSTCSFSYSTSSETSLPENSIELFVLSFMIFAFFFIGLALAAFLLWVYKIRN